MGDTFTSSLVSPGRTGRGTHGGGDGGTGAFAVALAEEAADAGQVAQEWLSEHMLQRRGEIDAEARMNRHVAERLAVELRAKCELTAQLQRANGALEARLAECGPAASRVAELEEESARLRAALDAEEARGRKLEADGAEGIVLRGEADRLRGEVREQEDVLARQKEGYCHLLEVSRRVAAQNQVLNSEAERLGAVVPGLEQERDSMRSAAHDAAEMRAENGRLSILAGMVGPLTQEVAELREAAAQVAPLQAERQRLVVACERIAGDVPEMNAQLAALTEECGRVPALEAEVVRTRAEADVLRTALADAEETAARLSDAEATLPMLREELRATQRAASEVPGLLALRDRLTKVADDLAARYEADVSSRDARLEEAAEAAQRLRQRVAELELGVAAQGQRHAEAARVSAAEAAKRLAEKDAVARSLEEERRAEVAALTRQLETQRDALRQRAVEAEDMEVIVGKNVQLHRDLETAKNAFDKARSAVEAQEKELSVVRAQLAATSQENEVLRQSHSKAQQQQQRQQQQQQQAEAAVAATTTDTTSSPQQLPPPPGPPPAATLGHLHQHRDISPRRRSVSAVPVLVAATPSRQPHQQQGVVAAAAAAAAAAAGASGGPHPSEVVALRRYMSAACPDIAAAAAEADSLGYHPKGYWTEQNCRRTKVWMSQPLQC